MIPIEEHDVDALASNAGAMRNGRSLVAKGRYSALSIADDGAIVFGRCQGSSAGGYTCSFDFADPAKPVSRCSCPSRQIPCKHCLGLLYAWVKDATRFVSTELPKELKAKRETTVKRAASKQARTSAPAKPKKVSVKALRKKLQAQSDALALLETILGDLLLRGLGTHGHKEAAALGQNAAMLRGAWLPGAELALLRLSDVAARASEARPNAARQDSDAVPYHRAMDELARLEALIRRGRAYLEARIADPALAPETDTAIAAWLGHVWKYEELVAAGCGESAAELVQLAFFVIDDRVKEGYADTGIWLHLGDGRLFHTETLRPYRALDHIKADDSDFDVAQVPDFVRYPGDSPERVRWRGREHRALGQADYDKVNAVAETDFASTLKRVKNGLKSPLGACYPVALVRPSRCGAVIDGERTRYAIEDDGGTRIELADPDGALHGVPPTAHLMSLLGDRAEGASLLCLFHMDPRTLRLTAQPLTFVHDGSMTRLAS